VTPGGHQLLNVLIGLGIAGTSFGVILGVVGRAAAPANRSMALGIATAAGSGGQVVGPPLAEALLRVMPWSSVFLVFAALVLAALLFLPMLRVPARTSVGGPEEGMAIVLERAFRDPSYTLIFLGFFSCGYQLGFITAHFPAFITEACAAIDPTGTLASLGINTTSALGAVAIAVIGLANIGGTLAAGALGQHFRKKYLLAQIYLARTVIAAAFILAPMTPASVLLFSLLMGALWLATVPLTSGLVAQIWGIRYMGTLYGIVFLSHQIGAFLGVWLGGRLYDLYGGYDLVWWVGVGVGAFSALVHLPIREAPAALRAA
jgi:predicted MFS family arabinose efflux permease